MRDKIYRLVEPADEKGLAKLYDIVMLIAIVISIIPLAMKDSYAAFAHTERLTIALFLLDYVLRWLTADLKLQKGAKSFLLYPFTPMAIIDLLSMLPAFTPAHISLKLFRLIRMFRLFRIFRAFRYAKIVKLFKGVLQSQRDSLLMVCWIAGAYILISALIILNVEPQTFDSFFDAIYWATVSLTTVGYGDIYPVTTAGRVVAMISSLFGIAIIALPAGIISAGLMEEISKEREMK